MSLTSEEMEQLKILLSKVSKEDINKEAIDGITEPEAYDGKSINLELVNTKRTELREKWFARSDTAPPWIEEASKVIAVMKEDMFGEASIKDLVYKYAGNNPPGEMVEFLVDNVALWRIQKTFYDANKELFEHAE